jgi:hypothetical protein
MGFCAHTKIYSRLIKCKNQRVLDDESNIVDKIMDYVEQKSTGAVKGPGTDFLKLARKYLANIYNIRIKRTLFPDAQCTRNTYKHCFF